MHLAWGAQAWITQFYLQITPCLPLPRKRSPDGATTDCWSRPSNWSLLTTSLHRPRKDERLNWRSRLTYSERFTHVSGYPSTIDRAQDRESSPVKDQRSTTAPRNQPGRAAAQSKMSIGAACFQLKTWTVHKQRVRLYRVLYIDNLCDTLFCLNIASSKDTYHAPLPRTAYLS